MADLQGALGELKMTLKITRKDTGKVEEVELTSGITDLVDHEALMKTYYIPKEYSDERNPLDSK